jgi:hypothetical protein
VTADGSRAAHWEHTVAMTDDGPRILTLPPDGRPPRAIGPARSASIGLLVRWCDPVATWQVLAACAELGSAGSEPAEAGRRASDRGRGGAAETAPGERRVALVPQVVGRLRARGVRVVVEPAPGSVR